MINKINSKNKYLILFFVFTFLLSLSLLLPIYLFGKKPSVFPWSFLCLMANGTPSIIGIIFIVLDKVYDKKTFIRLSISF